MKKLPCRLLSLCLFLLLLVPAVSALADGGTDYWTCPVCGEQWNHGNYCFNCSAPRPASIGTAVNNMVEQIPGESNYWKVRLQSVNASSYIVNRSDPGRWVPAHAVDGNDETCWQFSIRNQAASSVTFDMYTLSAETVDAVWIKNGFWGTSQYGNDLFTMNCRARSVQIEFQYSGASGYWDAVSFTLPDSASRWDWQRLNVGRHTNVVSVRLRVTSVYTGTGYPYDVCLNEVMLVQDRYGSGYQPGGTVTPQPGGGSSGSYGYGVWGNLKMRLSTRSGPSTRYDEPGTFFGSNWQSTSVRVLGKSWDDSNNIWWVLVDFDYGSASYRVWTGLKRVNINIDSVPVIYSSGQGTIDPTSTRRGPGGNYAQGPTVYEWKDVVAFGRENGWVEVEYYDYNDGRIYRCWVPENKAHIDWTYGGY